VLSTGLDLAKFLTINRPLDNAISNIRLTTGYRFSGQMTFDVPGPGGLNPLEVPVSATLDRSLFEEATMLLYRDRLVNGEYSKILSQRGGGRLLAKAWGLRPPEGRFRQFTEHPWEPVHGSLDDLFEGRLLGHSIGFGIDFAFAGGMELLTIWNDPYYTTGQKFGRGLIRGGTNAFGGLVGAAGALWLAGCSAATGGTRIAAAFVGGVAGGFFVDGVATERIANVFVGQKERRLKPLQ